MEDKMDIEGGWSATPHYFYSWDKKTVEDIMFLFGIFSDSSAMCLGYRALAHNHTLLVASVGRKHPDFFENIPFQMFNWLKPEPLERTRKSLRP